MTTGRPRILFYTENTVVGGSERYLRDLIGSLYDRGYAVRIGCNPDPGLIDVVSAIRGSIPVDVLPVRALNRSAAFQWAQKTGATRASRLQNVKRVGAASVRLSHLTWNIRLLRRWIERTKPDIVHINNGGYPGGESCRAAAVAARLAQVPVNSMFVHNLARERGWPVATEAVVDHMVARCLDTLIAASRASADTLVARRGFPRALLTVIPYGITVPGTIPAPLSAARRAALGLPPRGRLVGAVGRLEERKGQTYLLEAISALRREPDMADVALVLVGSGPAEAEYRALASRLGVAAHTIFTGQRGDVLDIVSACDAFVMSSVDFESLPFALLEALSLGRPVIATRVAGMPEAIQDGYHGLLVEPGSVQELNTALQRLLRDPHERQRLGQAAHARAESVYNLTGMVDRTIAHYQHLLTSHRAASPRCGDALRNEG